MHEGALAFLVAVSSSNKREEESPMKSENPTMSLRSPYLHGENQEFESLRANRFFFQSEARIKPEVGSSYIRSVCEPFDIEMELDLKKAENWLAHFGLYPYTQIHASGHLNYDAI